MNKTIFASMHKVSSKTGAVILAAVVLAAGALGLLVACDTAASAE